MKTLALGSALVGLMLAGAIFGFFYAWVCSTMWGLDGADPRIAIAAMQAMNASVRNMVFAPAFFATPVVLIAAGAFAWVVADRRAGALLVAAGLVYLFGGMILTIAVNVPMNEALGALRAPADRIAAQAIWAAYSGPWQAWNTARTVASGVTLLLAGLALFRLGRALPQ